MVSIIQAHALLYCSRKSSIITAPFRIALSAPINVRHLFSYL